MVPTGLAALRHVIWAAGDGANAKGSPEMVLFFGFEGLGLEVAGLCGPGFIILEIGFDPELILGFGIY
jgi:hypothetical protein